MFITVKFSSTLDFSTMQDFITHSLTGIKEVETDKMKTGVDRPARFPLCVRCFDKGLFSFSFFYAIFYVSSVAFVKVHDRLGLTARFQVALNKFYLCM